VIVIKKEFSGSFFVSGKMFEDDLGVFFDLDGHGVEIILENGDIITGIFDVPLFDDNGIASSYPQAMCKTRDVEHVNEGDKVEIVGVMYEIRSCPPGDGTGVTMIFLVR